MYFIFLVAEVESPHHDVVPSKQDIEAIPIFPIPPAIHVETSFDEDDYPTEVHYTYTVYNSACLF